MVVHRVCVLSVREENILRCCETRTFERFRREFGSLTSGIVYVATLIDRHRIVPSSEGLPHLLRTERPSLPPIFRIIYFLHNPLLGFPLVCTYIEV